MTQRTRRLSPALCALLLAVLLPPLGCGDSGTSDAGGDDSGETGGDPSRIVGDSTSGGDETAGDPVDASSGDPGSDAGPVFDLDAYDPGLLTDSYTGPPVVDLDPQPLGGLCGGDDDCETDACNTAHPGGYCTNWCSGNADCPEGAQCFNDNEAGEKMCWKSCTGHWECALHHFCTGGDFGVCTPKCVPGGCANPSYDCNVISGICEPEGTTQCQPSTEVCDGQDNDCDNRIDEGCGPGVADVDNIIVEDFGAVQVGGGGLSLPMTFDLSTAAASFTILLIDADGSDEILGVYELDDPNGQQLVTSYSSDPPIQTTPEIGALAVQVPNTPNYELVPGAHTFTIVRYGDPIGSAWVYVVQSIREDLSPSKMDINFWFVGTPGLTSSTAPSNEKFAFLQKTFTNTLANHSVLVEEINYYDVVGTDAQTYTFVDVSFENFTVDEHSELLTLSDTLPADNRGVNIFLVQGFNGWGLLGKAGGIPGPPLLHGTYHSGVVVSLAEYYELEDQIGVFLTAEAMAHELGHQIGLFHTSEQTGDFFDPIPDTPQCPKSKDTNQDGVVDPIECEGLGGDNLMFWATSFATVLTPGQKYVVHRNASMY